MITADDVIRERQQQIFDQVQEIERELKQMDKLRAQLQLKKDKMMIEHEILEAHNDRGSISVTTTTTTVRMKSDDKLVFEDILKKVFMNAGRPLRMVEIIKGLEKFGYQWSSYESAHSYIRRVSCVSKVPQARGIYQYVR